MRIRFTKMQGAGNDFVVLDETRGRLALTPGQYRFLADRHYGIGADQVLSVRPSPGEGIDFEYVIHNADGGEVEQCGNGARCFVRFVREHGLTSKDEIHVETLGGLIAPRLEADGQVTVDMGAPIFDPPRVPFLGTTELIQPLALPQGGAAQITALSMGNPHAVQFVDEVDAAPVTTQGPQIEHHRDFPKRVNAGYAQVLDRHRIKLRVWERGAGETLACGTGACAAVVAGMRRGLLDSPVRVGTRGGDLTIQWNGEDTGAVRMTGPAVTVFDGEIELAT